MSTLFYTKKSRVSRIRAVADTDRGDEKRTGEVLTLDNSNVEFSCHMQIKQFAVALDCIFQKYVVT